MDITDLLLYTITANIYASHPLAFRHYFIILLHVQEYVNRIFMYWRFKYSGLLHHMDW